MNRQLRHRQERQNEVRTVKKEIENVNTVQLPCNIGDVVKYTDEYSSFEFVVEKTVIDSEETRIYGQGRGCVVYARTFPEHCVIVR